MMAVTWTKEQQQVISLRDRNILVSAAAGAGKTAVLVERILSLITDTEHPVDIDSLLVVTFTRQAAAEMRERIRAGIDERLAREPDNEHLQRQNTLIHHAQINTIDSFCAYVIRNYFHMIDLDPGYRTAEEGELRLLREDVLGDVMEEAYSRGDAGFLELVENYAPGRDDSAIRDYVLKLYDYAISDPWPEDWLRQCASFYDVDDIPSLAQTSWIKAAMEETDARCEEISERLGALLELCAKSGGPYMYAEALQQDLAFVEKLLETQDFDARVTLLAAMKPQALSRKRDTAVSDQLRLEVREERNAIKDLLTNLRDGYFVSDLGGVLNSVRKCRRPIQALVQLTLDFSEAFAAGKREQNLVDFADLEHFALQILVRKEEDGLVRSQAAEDLAKQFTEIFIDEYQDSNQVQELILRAVSRESWGENNLFMVGDVKQSIYRFRQACPALFMEKYHTYTTGESTRQRIDLHQNFRSRTQILETVNYLFYQMMGDALGGVSYDEDAALYPGAVYPEPDRQEDFATEVLLLSGEDDADLGIRSEESQEMEALAVAEKIQSMVGQMIIQEKDGAKRPARYGDCAVLLRARTGWAETFGRVLTGQGVPSYTASRTGYFSAQEVVTVLHYLRILDNPRQEIPLGAVLHSPICGCSAEELAQIRLVDKNAALYDCARRYPEENETGDLAGKLRSFWKTYDNLHAKIPYTPIHELISLLLDETQYGIYAAAMPAGEQREANLRMLVERAMEFEQTSYRGLFNFIRYIEQLRKYDVDYGEVNIAGDSKDQVRIMSIHESKGLEFPIVILAGMGKKMNQQDVIDRLVLDQQMGIGADCVDETLRVKYPTLIRQVIQHRVKSENLGEELRVLYVAMTRAREKLILTGRVKNLEKMAHTCLTISRRQTCRLPLSLLENAGTYYDWVLPALARHLAFCEIYERYGLESETTKPQLPDEPPLTVTVLAAADLVASQVSQQAEVKLTREILQDWDQQICYNPQLEQLFEERFHYRYPWEAQRDIPAKVSVSELKKQGQTAQEEEFAFYFEPDVVPLVPAFMREEETLTGADRGTAYHRLLECLDFAAADTVEGVAAQTEALVEAGKMERHLAAGIDAAQIAAFVQSALGKRLLRAQQTGSLRREQPFVISVKASQIRKRWGDDETVLVQGIIDAYFREEGGFVIVDYKTDRVNRVEELKKRYQIQLDTYAQALEKLTGCRVSEKIIYSFTLGERIEV